MKDYKRYTVTAALPYANGPIHIGHLAGCYLPADIYARYLRLTGRDVLFVCGSDEHGVPITIKAKNEGISPQQVVDKYHKMMKDAFAEFGISFDIYSRTSSKIHHQTSSEFFEVLYDKKVFEEKITQQYYDEDFKMFLTDRNIVGTCPKCGNENAYGDQCEKCGSSLDPMDLISPASKLSGKKPILKETKHWYLPLNKIQKDWLEAWINTHDPAKPSEENEAWKINVFGQCKSWLNQGLQPRAVTRDLEWGVPVPLPEAKGKVLYVWFDAPIGYISATKDYFKEKANKDNWELYWKKQVDGDNAKLVHFIGKDNIVFHCLMFPAMLGEYGEFLLPENVPANEFLNLEGDKISTSRNWAVWLHEYLVDFKDKQDVLRYVLCSNAPETKDNDFLWKDFQAKNNNELVAILGNFVNRTLVLTQKYYEGKVPENIIHNEEDIRVENVTESIRGKIFEAIEKYRFREALAEVMNLARLGNKYLADNEPWKLIESNPERVKTVLNISLQVCAKLGILMSPFMPFTSLKILRMLNLEENILKTKDILIEGSMGKSKLPVLEDNYFAKNHVINTPELLFGKIEDAEVNGQIQKLSNSKKMNDISNNVITSAKPEASFEDFSKMDIRIGTIVAAEKVPKTQKLLKLTIDTGLDRREVVSGIAEYYKPEEIIGQQVSILVNLEPRNIKGVQSKGMVLMAEDGSGQLSFVVPQKKIENGGVVR